MIPPLIAEAPYDTVAQIPTWLDLLSVLIGSFSGILVARRRNLDLVGFVALSLLCGLGGGLIRDVIMQRGGVYMLDSPNAIPLTVLAGTLGYLFSSVLERAPRLLMVVDIVSVGLFVATGTGKAMSFGLSFWACLLMGVTTGVGGGMLRDIALGETPHIFRKSNLYAVCAAAGALCYYLLVLGLHVSRFYAVPLCVLVVVGIRLWSVKFDVMLPVDIDLAPQVGHAARRAWRGARRRGRGAGRQDDERDAS